MKRIDIVTITVVSLLAVLAFSISLFIKNAKDTPITSHIIANPKTIPFFTGANLVTYMPEIGPLGQKIPGKSWPTFLQEAKSSLQKMHDDNIHFVEIVCRIQQEGPEGTTFRLDDAGIADTDLISLIKLAKSIGIIPIIKPHLFVKNELKGNQRGTIGKNWSKKDEAIEQEWFVNYEAYIMRYVTMSRENNLPYFVIATELPSLVTDTAQTKNRREIAWRRLINNIRDQYDGKLTYASNSISVNDIKWWDALDYIGLDAYFTLVNNDTPTLDEIKQGWFQNMSKRTIKAFPNSSQPINIVMELEQLSQKFNRPIVFTEIGYRSSDTAATDDIVNFGIQQWNKKPMNYELQANLYRGIFEIFGEKPWFKGIFFWSWYPGNVDTSNKGFQHTHIIQTKPAEEVIKEEFGKHIE